MKLEKTITNICPISGVTAAQLLDQCKYLIKAIPASFGLDMYELNDVINDTVMKVLDKMQAGKVPKFNYEDYKDYLFMALKTNINRMYHNRKYLLNNITNDISLSLDTDDESESVIDIAVYDSDRLESADNIKLIQTLAKQLSDLERAAIDDFLNGLTPNEIDEKYGKKRFYYHITRKLANEVKPEGEGLNRKKNLGEKILKLHSEGLSISQIRQKLRCSHTAVKYHINPEKKASMLAYQHGRYKQK